MGLNDHEYLGIQKYPPDMYKHYWNICLYMSGHTNIMGSNNHMCLGIQKYPDAYKHHGNVYSYVQADVIHVWATNKYLYIDGHTPYMYNCLDCHTPYMYNCSFSWMGIQEFIYNAYGTWQKLTVCKKVLVHVWADTRHVHAYPLYGYYHMCLHIFQKLSSNKQLLSWYQLVHGQTILCLAMSVGYLPLQSLPSSDECASLPHGCPHITCYLFHFCKHLSHSHYSYPSYYFTNCLIYCIEAMSFGIENFFIHGIHLFAVTMIQRHQLKGHCLRENFNGPQKFLHYKSVSPKAH